MPVPIGSPGGRSYGARGSGHPPAVECREGGQAVCHFGNLDGRDLSAMGRRWRIEVYSIRDIELERYVQLALRGDPSYMVTVQLSVAHGVRDLVFALVRWLTRPSASSALIRVG